MSSAACIADDSVPQIEWSKMSRRLLIMCICAFASSCVAMAIWWQVGTTPDSSQMVSYARMGDVSGVADCLRKGLNANTPERWGWHKENAGQTPLTAAAQHGHVDVVKMLLQNGADPNLRDSGDEFPHETPLSTAVIHGQIEVCQMLLAAGADPNIVTNPKDSQWTALDWALQAKQPAIAKLLREHGAVESGRRRGG